MVGGMEQVTTILGFFFISWALGFTVLDLVRTKRENFPEYQILAELGIGVATFAFLGVILSILHIPLHIFVFVGLAAIYPIFSLFRPVPGTKKKKQTWKRKELIIIAILLIIAIWFFTLFHKGAFIYPYLENDDPWNHAQSTLYIATTHSASVDPEVRALNPGYANYLEPYPPSYDIMMGVLRQSNSSTVWTLKFFNALLITMGLLFFFLFFKEYLQDAWKALFATTILAVLPSFMSHFIWAQTLALVIFPVAFYATLKAVNDTSWRIPAIIATASLMVTQPVISFFYGQFIILFIALLAIQEFSKKGTPAKRFAKTINALYAAAGGLLISMLYWGVQFVKMGLGGIGQEKGGEITGGWASAYALQSYTFSEVFYPPHSSKIDQAIGWGPVVTVAMALGILFILLQYKKTLNVKKNWRYLHTLLWFIPLFYLVFAQSFGMQGWGSARLWVLLAIPLAALATDGVFTVSKGLFKKKTPMLITVGVILVLLAVTSAPAKMTVQTAMWPPGAQWAAPQVEIPGYIAMQQQLPANTKVFSVCSGDQRAIGFDMYAEPWNRDAAEFRSRLLNVSTEEFVGFLKLHGYQYVTLDATCALEHGENETVRFATDLSESNQFVQVISQGGFLLAQVR